MSTWRTGRKLGRTLYKDEVCIGMVDTPELARAIVIVMNSTSTIARILELEKQLAEARTELEELRARVCGAW